LERITLQQQADQVSEEAEEAEEAASQAGTVAMMTVHCSKGLEFDAVFVTGLEDRLFPLIPAPEVSDAHLDEERRLGYVALTRARKRLFLTNARRRRLYGGEPRETRPSRFLADIPPALLRVSSDSVERTVLWRDPLPQAPGASRWSADELAQVAPLVKLPPKVVPSVSSSGLAARPKSAEDLRKLLDDKRKAERVAQGAAQEEGEAWSVRPDPSPEPAFEEPQVVYDDEFAQEEGAGRLAKSGRSASKQAQRGSRAEDEYSQAPPSSGEQTRRTAPVKNKTHRAASVEEAAPQEVEQAPSAGLAFHAKEGPGEILASYGSGDKATVLVRFARTGREMTVLRRYLKIIE
jgi:ATP-dependent exoDNAse (exonuclease V) beta subunit